MNTPTLTGVDIGSPSRCGGSTPSADGLEIEAGGEDIWGHRDEGHFAYLLASGDFELSVRLELLAMADTYTKAGIMFRSSLDAGAAHAYLLAFGDNQPRNRNNGGLEFQYRMVDGGPCTAIYPPPPPPSAA